MRITYYFPEKVNFEDRKQEVVRKITERKGIKQQKEFTQYQGEMMREKGGEYAFQRNQHQKYSFLKIPIPIYEESVDIESKGLDWIQQQPSAWNEIEFAAESTFKSYYKKGHSTEITFADEEADQGEENYQSSDQEEQVVEIGNVKYFRSCIESASTSLNRTAASTNSISRRKQYDVVLKNFQSQKPFPPLQLSIETPLNMFSRVYLFMNQMLDMDYIQYLAAGKEQEFFERNNVSTNFQQILIVERIIHRMDNCFIETHLSHSGAYQLDISPLIYCLKSMGNARVAQISDSLENFWKNTVEKFRTQIRIDKARNDFQHLKQARKNAALKKFKELTEGLDQDMLYCYFELGVNYDKEQFDLDILGYSPKLVELIGNNSYAFIDHIMKNGHFDPISREFRTNSSIYLAQNFAQQVNALKGGSSSRVVAQKMKIPSIDGFLFPSTFSLQRFNLTSEFDSIHQIDYNTSDSMSIMHFEVEGIEQILEHLRVVRENNSLPVQVAIKQSDQNGLDITKTELFEKYYADKVDNLVSKGNKWFKRCGYVDIPKKKQKQ